jgi:hypothetical protein
MVLLLGSRSRSRTRGKSGFGQVFRRISQLVSGRSVKNERPSKGAWILPAIALLCFAGGFVVGGQVAAAKEVAGAGKSDLRSRPGPVGEMDTTPTSQDSLLVAYYNGVEAETAKGYARSLVNYLHSKDFKGSKPREFATKDGPVWGVVVYCIGERDLKATRERLKELPLDVPDTFLASLRETKTDDGLVWPFTVRVQ